jgi:hypothetical protein
VRIDGVRYSHPLLQALPTRTVVDLALPWRRDPEPLFRTLSGAWVELKSEVPYSARWIEGARESSRRQQRQSQYVSKLALDAPSLDPVAIKLRAAKRRDIAPPPRLERLDIGDEHQELMAGQREAAIAREAPTSTAEAQRAREMAITERLERTFATDD